MRNLDLIEMENIEGGNGGTLVSCFGGVVGLVGLTVLAIAGGPVGWLAWGSAIGSGLSTGFSLGNCAYQLREDYKKD